MVAVFNQVLGGIQAPCATGGRWVVFLLSSMLSKDSVRVVLFQLLCSTLSWRRYYCRRRAGRQSGLPSRPRILRRRGSSSWSTWHDYSDRDARHLWKYSRGPCTRNVRRAGITPLLHSCSTFLWDDVCRDIDHSAFLTTSQKKRG